jgi:hypothetical protein
MREEKYKPLLGKEREERMAKAMKLSKRDLAIMYIDLKWSFDQITKKLKR